MSVSLTLNDRVIIKSKNDIFNNTTGVITFFSEQYLRIFTSLNEDLLISLKPYDTRYEITKMTILRKAATPSFITQNGLVENKFAIYYLKENSKKNYAKITNVNTETNEVTIQDINNKNEYTLDLTNGVSPDLPIYYIQYVPSSEVPKPTKEQEYAIEEEEGYFDLGDLEQNAQQENVEIDEKDIIYNDEIQVSDMISDLLLKNVNEIEALDIARELIQLKNLRKKLSDNERGFRYDTRDENYKAIVEQYETKKHLPNWIRPIVNNKRVLFDDNLELNEITTNSAVQSQKELMNTFQTNISIGNNYGQEEEKMMKTIESREDDTQMPFDVEIFFENPENTDVLLSVTKRGETEGRVESQRLVSQITNEPISIAGFLSSFRQAMNDLKSKEYIPICILTGENDIYLPLDRDDTIAEIQQERVKELEKDEKYIFCIQEGDLGTQKGVIIGGTITDIKDQEITIEPINPELKKKLPSLRLDTNHLEIYRHGVEEVHCIFSIMKQNSISKTLDTLVSTQDIYLKMSPINQFNIVNSRMIFQYLELFAITRRNLHYKHYDLFRRVLNTNISNYETGIYDNVYQLPQETSYPLISSNLFDGTVLNSKESKQTYVMLNSLKQNVEYIRYLEREDPTIFTLLHAIVYHRNIYAELEKVHTEQTSQYQILSTKQQRLRQQIEALKQQMEVKIHEHTEIKKEYSRMSTMKKDEKDDTIMIDKKYDTTNRDLFNLVRMENPNAVYSDQVKILQQKLIQMGMTNEEGNVSEQILQNHIMGGAMLQPGNQVLVKEKNVIQIFTYNENREFVLHKETTTKPTNIQQDILHGEDDLDSLSLQSLLDKTRQIIQEDRNATLELRELQMEYNDQENTMVSQDLLKKYSNHIRLLEQEALYKTQQSNYQKALLQNRRDFVYPEIDPVTDFYISKQEKETVDVETLDTTDEYSRDGSLKVRRRMDVQEKPLSISTTTEYARKYLFFIQIIEDIFDVEFSNRDKELGFEICSILEGQIPKGKKYKQKQKNTYIVSIFATALVFILQIGTTQYDVTSSIGSCSFTRRGYPLDIADEAEPTLGIIKSLACFLKTLKIQITQSNIDKSRDLTYIKPKVEVFEKTIYKFVNAILSSNPQIRNMLRRKQEQERQQLKRLTYVGFQMYPIEKDDNAKLQPVVKYNGLSETDKRDYVVNEANIYLTIDGILRDFIKEQEPILLNSTNRPFIGNSVSYYKGNEERDLINELNGQVTPLLYSLRNQAYKRFNGTTTYAIPLKIINAKNNQVDYRLPIDAVIRLAKKSNPSADLSSIEFDRKFFQGLLRELRLQNLIPTPMYLPESTTQTLGEPKNMDAEKKEELYAELIEQLDEIADLAMDDFRDDYVITDENIPSIFNSVVKSVFIIYLARILTNKKQPTNDVKTLGKYDFLKHVFDNKKLALVHRHTIELILRGRDLTSFYKIMDDYQGQERVLLTEKFGELKFPIQMTSLDFVKIITDFMSTFEEDSDMKDIAIRLIVEGIKMVMNTMNILAKTKEELQEYMSSIIERERNMIISQDDKLKDDMDKRQLNKIQKALKLGVWALGAQKGWDYTAELYEMEVEQLKEWEQLQKQAHGGVDNIGAGNFTPEMMDARENAAEDRRVENEELQFQGEAEED